MFQIDKSTPPGRVGRLIWTVGGILLTRTKLSFWLINLISPPLRQHSIWTHRQAVANELMRAYLYHSSCADPTARLTLLPRSLGRPCDPAVYITTASGFQPCISPGPTINRTSSCTSMTDPSSSGAIDLPCADSPRRRSPRTFTQKSHPSPPCYPAATDASCLPRFKTPSRRTHTCSGSRGSMPDARS